MVGENLGQRVFVLGLQQGLHRTRRQLVKQLSVLAWLPGGLQIVRIWHFAGMLGLVSFVPGHMMIVALHGWNNFRAC
jgi:thiosulfate reductase cytochrome b subunit